MGAVTYVTSEVDEDRGVLEVIVLTRMGEQANSNRIMLNYAASRAAGHTSAPQRALKAAAAKEHDITWVEGPFTRNPLQMFPEAENIDYEFMLVSNDEFGRTPVGETRFMHKWTLPLEKKR